MSATPNASDTACLWIYPARGAWERLTEMTKILCARTGYKIGSKYYYGPPWQDAYVDLGIERHDFGVN